MKSLLTLERNILSLDVQRRETICTPGKASISCRQYDAEVDDKLLSRADVKDNVKLIFGVPFANSRLFNVHLTLETRTESQFCVSVGCDGFRKSVSGRIDSSVLSLFLLRCSFSLALSPSFRFSLSLSLLPVLAFLPSFLPSFLYVREISQEFAYVQITSRWFEISHHQICSRQPYRFRFSALQARHVRACFECPGTLRPLPSHKLSETMNEKENRNKEDSVAKVICHAQRSAKKKLLGKSPGLTCKKNPHVIVSATEIKSNSSFFNKDANTTCLNDMNATQLHFDSSDSEEERP